MTSRFCRRYILKSELKFYKFNLTKETKADAVYYLNMPLSESTPQIPTGTCLETKANNFLLGCVIIDKSIQIFARVIDNL
jgi:hypothetical protein